MANRSPDGPAVSASPRIAPAPAPQGVAAGIGAVVPAKSWEISREAFDGFLAALGPDRDAAAVRYEQIRARLVRFFEWRGCSLPEDRADDAITRVIRKLHRGDVIDDPGAYCYGVARLVLLESLKDRERERAALTSMPAAPDAVDAGFEERVACLRACLRTLAVDQRSLIVEYHRHDGPRRIEGRKQLAARLGLGMNALRIRAHRLSERLADCVTGCLQRRGAS